VFLVSLFNQFHNNLYKILARNSNENELLDGIMEVRLSLPGVQMAHLTGSSLPCPTVSTQE
jgi:hypothetical protein